MLTVIIQPNMLMRIRIFANILYAFSTITKKNVEKIFFKMFYQ